MKRILIPVFSLLLFGQLLTSCGFDDKEILPNAIVDVYIRTQKDNGIVKYALFAYSEANYEMKNVSYIAPNDDTKKYELTSNKNPYVFSNYGESDPTFTEVIPVKGDYSFTILSNKDIKMERKNVLQDKVADIGEISEAKIVDEKLSIKWKESKNTHFFIVRLLDNENKEIYSSDFISSKTLEINISERSKGWHVENISLNNVVKVKLMTVLFENSEYYRINEIQSIGITLFDVIK